MKWLTAFLVCVCMLVPQTVLACMTTQDTVMGVQGYNVKTPEKNIFKIDGDDREYILIDWNNNEKSAFFVMTKEIFPKREFDKDSTQKFDIEDENNIGYYLNKDFRESSKLSEKILDAVDNDHVWETEAGDKNGNCPEGYSVKCGICLMSQTEWLHYYPQFGIRDDLEEKYTGWWLRTARGIGGNKNTMLIVKSLPAEIGRTNTWNSNNPMYVRPVFYLNRSIFLDSKLNLNETGSRVKRAVNSLYSNDELASAGYSEREIDAIRNYSTDVSENIEISLDKDYLGNIMNPEQLKIRINVNITGQTAKKYIMTANADGKLYTKEFLIRPDGRQTLTVPLENPPKGSYELEIRLTDGDRIAEQQYIHVTIINDYKSAPLDELSGWGFATHFGLENRSEERDALLLQKMGAKQIRDELSWHKTEKTKGVFDFSRHDGWIESVYDKGIDVIAVLNSNNDLYTGEKNVPQIGIKNTEQLDGYLRYAENIAEHYPQITKFEIWNEPDGNNFWRPTANSYDYANTLKAVYETLKKSRPDSYVMAFSCGCSDFAFMNGCLENGAYAYFDSASIHPYQSNNPAESLQFKYAVKNASETMWKYGGWKEIDITEMGFANQTGVSGATESWSALQQIKSFVIAKEKGIENYTVYDFRNDGTNPDNREDNYGNIRYDYKGKKGYAAQAQLYQEIGASPCIGKVETEGGADVYVFNRNGKPVITAWHGAGKSAMDFGSGVVVKDIYGNVIGENGNLILKNDLVYIENADESWFVKAAEGSFMAAAEEYRSKYSDNEELIKKSEKLLCAQADSKALKELLEDYRKTGIEIIGEETPLEASKKTDMLYNMAKPLFSLLGTAADDEADVTEEHYDLYKDTVYAKNMNRRSRDAYKKAQTAGKYSNTDILKYSYAKKYESAFLTSWAQEMKTKEQGRTDIIMQLFDGQFSGFTGENKNYDIIIRNMSEDGFAGMITAVDESGQSSGVELNVSIPKGQTADFSLPVTLGTSGEESVITFILYDSNGIEIQRVLTHNKLKARIETELLYADDTVENLTKLDVRIKNLSQDKVDVFASLSGDKNLILDSTEKKITVNGGETKLVSVPVKHIKDTPYHFYTVRMKVTDEEKNVIYDAQMPLGFTAVTKTGEALDTSVFDGDMTVWQDAYPFYLNPPEDMENKYAWTTSDTAAIGFLKWSDDSLYLLADVYDDTHLNVNNGINLWNGDCLQVSVDALNTKSNQYDADDYEYGFAEGTQGKEAYLWQSPSGTGSVRGSIFNMIRDEDNKITRFLVRFNSEDIEGLSLKPGTSFGFNMSYNDADVIAREKWIQLTSGTADFKGPYLYHSFKLCDTVSLKEKYENLDEHFVIKISGSTNTGGFTDISGHWAEADILEANELGLLNCFKAASQIQPDAPVTRAEMSAMLVNGMEIAPKNDSKYIEDIPSGKWYTTIMYSALFQGIINENMLDGYHIFPEKNITREEMAVMGGSAWATKELWYDTEGLLFSDKGDISDWALQKIEIAADCGFINNHNGMFEPNAQATRAQAISMVMKMVKKLNGSR